MQAPHAHLQKVTEVSPDYSRVRLCVDLFNPIG